MWRVMVVVWDGTKKVRTVNTYQSLCTGRTIADSRAEANRRAIAEVSAMYARTGKVYTYTIKRY